MEVLCTSPVALIQVFLNTKMTWTNENLHRRQHKVVNARHSHIQGTQLLSVLLSVRASRHVGIGVAVIDAVDLLLCDDVEGAVVGPVARLQY